MNRTQEGSAGCGLRYGCSTKAGGTMLVAHESQIYSPGRRNRENFFKKSGIEHWAVCRLAHSTDIKVVTTANDHTIIYDVDGLITTAPNLFICLTVADCFPVYFWPKEKNFVGLAHAGWRGVSGNIIGKMVEKIKLEFSCLPEDLMAAIGQGIRQCHFEVKEDVLSKFSDFAEQMATRNGRTYIDLVAIIKHQLISAGIPHENITDAGECTYCLPQKYFSYRRDKTSPLDVMLAY